jgi:hypothetical protein
MPSGTRRHHYYFAHLELPAAAFRLGSDLVTSGGDVALTLRNAWDRVGEDFAEQDRVCSTGLAVSHHRIPGYDMLLITFPLALYPTEAYFAAVTLSTEDGNVRYFTLEDAVSPMTMTRCTVLGEWTSEGTHCNFGDGPEPRPDAFLDGVRSLLERDH